MGEIQGNHAILSFALLLYIKVDVHYVWVKCKLLYMRYSLCRKFLVMIEFSLVGIIFSLQTVIFQKISQFYAACNKSGDARDTVSNHLYFDWVSNTFICVDN